MRPGSVVSSLAPAGGTPSSISSILPNHAWPTGPVEWMNRTIKDATVKHDHYDSHGQLRDYLQLLTNAYNHSRRLKTLHGFTLYE
jgi:hypothetical protein